MDADNLARLALVIAKYEITNPQTIDQLRHHAPHKPKTAHLSVLAGVIAAAALVNSDVARQILREELLPEPPPATIDPQKVLAAVRHLSEQDELAVGGVA